MPFTSFHSDELHHSMQIEFAYKLGKSPETAKF